MTSFLLENQNHGKGIIACHSAHLSSQFVANNKNTRRLTSVVNGDFITVSPMLPPDELSSWGLSLIHI